MRSASRPWHRCAAAPAAAALLLAAHALAAPGPAPNCAPSPVAPIACYPANVSDDVRDLILRQTHARMPGAAEDALRIFIDPVSWSGDGQQGPSGQAMPARLTYSFPNDGVAWGLAQAGPVSGNVLNTRFISLFGSGNLDLGREYIRQSMASWRRFAALSYAQVDDDGSPDDQSTVRVPSRGDLRIGGFNVDQSLYLAYCAFPASGGAAQIGGGDMVINTTFFTYDYYNNPANNYRFLRNTIAHEFGHSLGLIHSVPCNATKLMEPFITTGFDMQTVDEIRAVQANHGDRFTPNQTASQAHDFGDLLFPVPHSISESNLSTNGASGPNGSGEDWFRFTISTAQPVAISAIPGGGSYTAGAQTQDCDTAQLLNINAASAGNLSLELRSADGSGVLAASTSNAAGSPETLSFSSLAAGTYCVRVFDSGPNPAMNQSLQLYTLAINVNGAHSPPHANAGVDKRSWAGSKTFYIGDVNSSVTESTAVLSGYEWDLDGDGAFETTGAEPYIRYVSNGTYPVSLRVTDSNGMTAVDTIHVTVFNASASITQVAPASLNVGVSTPVLITGTNFKGVVSAGQLSLSGSGAVFTGMPVVDAMGTTIGGLSISVASDAPTGKRDMSVTNADASGTSSGNATAAAIFSILSGLNCPGDLNNDGVRNTVDLGVLLGGYGRAVTPGTGGDLNGDGVVNTIDLGQLLSVFGIACP